jgi:hypothetical protein
MKNYTVSFGSRKVSVLMDIKTSINIDDNLSINAGDYVGGKHNYDGLNGAVIDRAVKKSFGKRCFWFGNYDNITYGQVFETLRPSKNDSNPGNTSRTEAIVIHCSYQEKGKIKFLF